MTKPGPKTKYWALTTTSGFIIDLGICESMFWLGLKTDSITFHQISRAEMSLFHPFKIFNKLFLVTKPQMETTWKEKKLTGFLCSLWSSITPSCTIKETYLWFTKAYHPTLYLAKNISIQLCISAFPILNQQCWETLAAKIKNPMINRRLKFMSIIYTYLLFGSVFYLDQQWPTELSEMMEMV